MELKKSINDAHLTNSPSKCQFDAAVEALENDTIIQIFNDGCKTVYEKIEDQKIRKVILEVKLAINILYELTIDTIERLNSILYKHLSIKNSSKLEKNFKQDSFI